jgi:hypothetical protein
MPADYPNLLNVATRSGDEDARRIVEALSTENSILEDIPWIPCNSGMKHITTVRTGLPKPAWRMLNAGVPKGKSTTTQVEVGCGMLESYAEVDKDLVALAAKNGGQEAADDFLETENEAYYMGFGQEAADALFYGDPSDPRQPVGLINYYNDGSADAKTRDNIISAGGTSDNANTSIWLVCWDKLAAHGIYPQGTTAGFKKEYLGVETATDDEGKMYQVLRTHYAWKLGFALRDWRTCVRICNVDAAKIKAGTTTTLVKCMIEALYRLPRSARRMRKAFYACKDVSFALHMEALDRAKYQIGLKTVEGEEVTTLLGVPIRCEEALRLNESKLILS